MPGALRLPGLLGVLCLLACPCSGIGAVMGNEPVEVCQLRLPEHGPGDLQPAPAG